MLLVFCVAFWVVVAVLAASVSGLLGLGALLAEGLLAELVVVFVFCPAVFWLNKPLGSAGALAAVGLGAALVAAGGVVCLEGAVVAAAAWGALGTVWDGVVFGVAVGAVSAGAASGLVGVAGVPACRTSLISSLAACEAGDKKLRLPLAKGLPGAVAVIAALLFKGVSGAGPVLG